MKIGDEVYVHGYVDEIRNGTIIIRNEGGYFGTAPDEVMPSAQPETHEERTETHACDLISRQAAIDGINELMKVHFDRKFVLGKARTIMQELPSAQPEIIRCTECKHYREYDSKYVENAVVVQCMADRYPISEIIPDGWFCAGAERKDDE